MCEQNSIAGELKAGRTVLVNTRGVSMRPLLRQGQTQVLIAPVSRPVKVGDLPLVYLRPGLSQLHRVIKTDENYVYTRGDNCTSSEKVSRKNILGLAVKIYRGQAEIPMDGFAYRFYTRFWLLSAPVRIPLMILGRKLSGLKRRLPHFVQGK